MSPFADTRTVADLLSEARIRAGDNGSVALAFAEMDRVREDHGVRALVRHAMAVERYAGECEIDIQRLRDELAATRYALEERDEEISRLQELTGET